MDKRSFSELSFDARSWDGMGEQEALVGSGRVASLAPAVSGIGAILRQAQPAQTGGLGGGFKADTKAMLAFARLRLGDGRTTSGIPSIHGSGRVSTISVVAGSARVRSVPPVVSGGGVTYDTEMELMLCAALLAA